METFSALLALCAGNSPVTGEFAAQRPVTRSFDVFFDLRMNKRFFSRITIKTYAHQVEQSVVLLIDYISTPWL